MTPQLEVLVAIIRPELSRAANLEDRVKKAMTEAINNWLGGGDETKFRAALAAAVLESEGEERDQLERSISTLGKVGACFAAGAAGVSVDIESLAADLKRDAQDGFKMLPLVDWWHERIEAAKKPGIDAA